MVGAGGVSPFRPEEMQLILQAASEAGPRDELIIRILAYTGMRVGECNALACGDIDLGRSTIQLNKVIVYPSNLLAVTHKEHTSKEGVKGRASYKLDKALTFMEEGPHGYTGKTFTLLPTEASKRFKAKGAGELVKRGLKASHPLRVVPLTDARTRQLLQAWIQGKDAKDYLFTSQMGTRISGQQMSRVVQKILMAGGIERVKAHPHNLRHTFAVNSLKSGMNVIQLQRILGHSDLATTNIYCRFVVEDLVQVMEKIGDPYNQAQ